MSLSSCLPQGVGHRTPASLDLWSPVALPVDYRGVRGVSQVPWVSLARVPSLYRPRGNLRARPLQRFDVASALTTAFGFPNCAFRGSITQPSCSVSTLRREGHPSTTQDSLPAGGRLRRAGPSPAGSLRKVSVNAPTSSSPFPRLRLAQCQLHRFVRPLGQSRAAFPATTLLLALWRGPLGLPWDSAPPTAPARRAAWCRTGRSRS